MTELEMVVLILIGVIIVHALIIFLLYHNIKIYKKELESKKYFIDPCDSPISIKMKCIDKQLDKIDKTLK